MMFSVAFWKAVAERAIKAFAYSLVATLSAGATDIVEMPWWAGTRIALGVAALSVLGSVVSTGLTGGGPSLTNAEQLPQEDV